MYASIIGKPVMKQTSRCFTKKETESESQCLWRPLGMLLPSNLLHDKSTPGSHKHKIDNAGNQEIIELAKSIQFSYPGDI